MTVPPTRVPDALAGQPITVGLGLYTGQRTQRDGGRLYSEALELAVAAEDAGFDAFWVSEHHGFGDSYLPAPLLLLSAIAARTCRIALGVGVVIAPLAHPLRLAEEAAVLDQLSGGRLVLGLGLGYAEHEYRAYSVDVRSRGAALDDLVALLRRAWRGDVFDWRGACYQGTRVRVTPVPVRSGGIPIWLGGYAERAVARAARLGDGYLLGRADDAIVDDVNTLLCSARDPADTAFTFALNVITVLTDDAGDEASARAGLAYQQTAYEAIEADGNAHAGRVIASGEAISAATVESYVHAYGSAESVAEQILGKLASLRSWGRIHVVIRAVFPEPDLNIQLERLARIGRDVLPRIRDSIAEGAGQ